MLLPSYWVVFSIQDYTTTSNLLVIEIIAGYKAIFVKVNVGIVQQ